jgi:hypothetical protein
MAGLVPAIYVLILLRKDVDARHKARHDEFDGIDEKTQAALSQIGREEKAAAADEVSPIVRHRASIAQQKVMGFAEPVIGPATSDRTRWLNPSYGLSHDLFEPSSNGRLPNN